MYKLIFIVVSVLLTLTGCMKDWLNEPSDKSKFIPATLEDGRLLLNHEDIFNARSGFIEESGADNYYLTDADWGVLNDEDKNCYIWSKDIFGGATNSDWNYRYRKISVANTVLEILNELPDADHQKPEWKEVYGEALFFRATAFFQVAQGFAAVYDKSTAATSTGIPLRLQSDLNQPTTRASLEETYRRIIMDLDAAVGLLPVKATVKTQPSKWATLALLARVYLSMSDYENALASADLALKIDASLMDFNTLNAAAANPIARFNQETIFYDRALTPNWFNRTRCKPDSFLYRSYHPNDLRKKVFFSTNGLQFKGGYDGTFSPFIGLATDELYLVRAECAARLNKQAIALNDLNTLLRSRWAQNTFTALIINDQQQLLETILMERRKELLFRNLRWTDLKRLNQEPAFATTIRRKIGNQHYELKPGDKRYVLPIPDDVIKATGIAQNER